MRIVELAQCLGLRSAIEKEQVLVLNWLYDIAARQVAMPEEFHSTLAEALCSGEALIADPAMRANARYGLHQILDRLANYNNRDNRRLNSPKPQMRVVKNGRKARSSRRLNRLSVYQGDFTSRTSAGLCASLVS
jgi:hypothetical protein